MPAEPKPNDEHDVQPNPYEAHLGRKAASAKFKLFGLFELADMIMLLPLLGLIVACVYHYSLIESPAEYRASICVGIEFVGLLFAILCVPIHIGRCLHFFFLRRFRQGLVSLFLAGISFCAVGWAMWYDAPTLLYMT